MAPTVICLFYVCLRALNGKLTVQEEQIAEYIDKIGIMEEEVKRVSDISQLWLQFLEKYIFGEEEKEFEQSTV